MKLNWAERWVVNNPIRVLEQTLEMQRLKEMLPLEPGFTALEIGCGRGAGARLILKEYQPSRIYAMDLDDEMISRARKYLSSEVRREVSFFVGDVSALPLKTASVEVVFGFGVLHHIPDWRLALEEIARVLVPRGVYFLEEIYPRLYQNFITRHILLHPTKDRFSGRELRQALADAKLHLKDYSEFGRLGMLGAAVRAA